MFTSECPGWLRVVGGKYEIVPELANSIREIHRLALDGYGISKLVRYANQLHLPVPGRRPMKLNGEARKNSKPPKWHASLIKRVLENRALIGQFQPHINEGRNNRQPYGEPIQNFYPKVLEDDAFFAVQKTRDKAPDFPARKDANNHNYLMGLAKCSCGGSWRWMNKSSGTQAGYSLYGCANRQDGTTTCANINGRLFDHQFIEFALNNIPNMLASGEDKQGERVLSLEAQLASLIKRKASIMGMVEENPDLRSEFAERLRTLLAEHHKLTEELAEAKRAESPPPGFTFDEALEVFLPAFLDVYEEGSDEFEDAYRARSLFGIRIKQSVKTALVSADRSTVTNTSKNGTTAKLEIETLGINDRYAAPSAREIDEVDRLVLVKARSDGLRRGRQINNASGGSGSG